jgi:hypothetical protein
MKCATSVSMALGSLAMLVSFAGTAAAAPEVAGPPSPSRAFEYRDGAWVRRPDSCGTHQHALGDAVATPPVFAAGDRITVYLNRNGGTYHGANSTNSADNGTVLVNGQFTIAPLDPDFDWELIRQCVMDYYAPYNIGFTETEPSGTYIEAVVGGEGDEIPVDLPAGAVLLGIASADNFCGVTQRGIAYSFSEAHRGIPSSNRELCATVAHEIGHLLSLEHETLANDLMSYVSVQAAGGEKSFVDQSSPCGTMPGQEMPSCSCGGNRTNSAARLRDNVGEAMPCTDEDDCSDGEVCAGQTCIPGPGVDGGLGTTCANDPECASGLCIFEGDNGSCAIRCDPSGDECPDDFTCRAFEDAGVCWQEGGGGAGGGCAAGGGEGGLAFLVGIGFVAIASRRRRA